MDLGILVITALQAVSCILAPRYWRVLAILGFLSALAWLQTLGNLPTFSLGGSVLVAIATSLSATAVGWSIASARGAPAWMTSFGLRDSRRIDVHNQREAGNRE